MTTRNMLHSYIILFRSGKVIESGVSYLTVFFFSQNDIKTSSSIQTKKSHQSKALSKMSLVSNNAYITCTT